MFEQTFVQTQTQAQTRKPWTVAASLSMQCGLIAVVLLIPLLHPEKLPLLEPPKPRPISTWVNLRTPPPVHTSTQTPALRSPSPARAFVYVPAVPAAHKGSIAPPSVDYTPTEWVGPPTGFTSPTQLTSVLPPALSAKPPVATPTPKPATPTGPIRVTQIDPAQLKFGPRPTYPQTALITRTQGTVKLEAIIATDGSIKNLRLISGPPLLVKAALDAVAQWKYQPTLLNGVAVEVLTEISVNFSLAR